MTQKEKQSIMDAARSYMGEKNISQNELSIRSGVNVSYIHNMMKGDFTFVNSRNGSTSDIKDVYFEKLAKTIGYELKQEYWPLVETRQLRDVFAALLEAKELSKTRVIIGETGCGKTYTLNRFADAYPVGTYIVTCSSSDYQKDLIRKIETAIGKDSVGTDSQRISRINVELNRRYDVGLKPVLIFDESEYLTVQGLLSVKSIYDDLKEMCGIVFIGTDDLLNNIKGAFRKPGMKQFHSRIEAGIRNVRAIDRDFDPFLKGRGFEKELIDELRKTASDYRVLADYLVPALKEADRLGTALTVELFKSINYLQNR